MNKPIQRDFERHHKCSEGPQANIAGLVRVMDSKRLLIVAGVPPVRACLATEYFGGYLISMKDGRRIDRSSPNAIEDLWKGVLRGTRKRDFNNLYAAQRAAMPSRSSSGC
jgi:hypothetical protein